MFTKNRYDIFLGRPGRVTDISEVKPPPDVSFLSDIDFLEFVQKEIKRRQEKNNAVFLPQLTGATGIGEFVIIDRADPFRRRGSTGVQGQTGIRGYSSIG